jgi:protein involved in polysaccharide export with SLBB domain
VIRSGRTVAIDFDALMKGDPQANIAVREDDEIVIDSDPSVVFVTGAVERRVAVPFHKEWDLEDYLDAAGGVAPNGVRDKVIVEYAGGSIARTSNSFFGARRDPPVRPGATITVSEKPPEREGAFRDTLVATSQIVSVLASIAIAIAALK